jgi:hypothetical protein
MVYGSMRHRIVNFGVPDCHVVQTIADSANDSCPIPAWGTVSAQTETDEIEKLKRFCLQQYTYLQEPLTQKSSSPQKKLTPHLIVFLSFGIYFCLSVPTPSYNFSLNTLLPASKNLNVHTSNAKTVQDFSYLFHLELSRSTKTPATKNDINPNSQRKTKAAAPNKLSNLGFISPVKGFPITSSFGSRVHPIFGGESFHQGIDIGTPSGTPIKASKAGYVIFAGFNGGYGKKIVIRHGGGYQTLYAHLDELFVQAGDRVKQEEVIGLSGSTGYVTGPHLHFEIHANQVAHNPLDYF